MLDILLSLAAVGSECGSETVNETGPVDEGEVVIAAGLGCQRRVEMKRAGLLVEEGDPGGVLVPVGVVIVVKHRRRRRGCDDGTGDD